MNLRPVDSNRSVPLPEVITVPWRRVASLERSSEARSLLTDVLDIAGWPKRRFYDARRRRGRRKTSEEMLKLSATDEQEKENAEGLKWTRDATCRTIYQIYQMREPR